MTDIRSRLMRTYHYATGLSIEWYEDNEPRRALPADASSVGVLLLGGTRLSALPPFAGELLRAQYVNTRYRERFICLRLNEKELLLAGPTLAEPMSETAVLRLIRSEALPIWLKPSLVEYYSSLAVADDNRYYYSGKLLEDLCGAMEPAAAQFAAPADDGIQKSYFENTYGYRMKQFQHPPYALEQEICRLIANGDKENSANILAEINAAPRALLAPDPVRSLKNSLIASCTFMTRAAISGGVSPDEAFTLSDAFIQRMEDCAAIEQLLPFEGEMIRVFTARVNQLCNAKYSQTVRQAMTYIENHLSEPMRLSEIAEHVYVNPHYLCGLFKKETGESLFPYIQRKRVEESKSFIRYSSSTFAEIAAFYQFCSQSHFGEAFKKYTGMTPGAYRNQFR
ncbi:MAG TPA: AraC family transcriptional regulator [Feifaniaceae bacterium]|nr:AraC family transcriptional regulator [Feifaniaceae bacterium]